MRSGTRDDPDQGSTRTVVWADGSETDLSALIAASVSSVIFVVAVVLAAELHGIPRLVAAVVAAISGVGVLFTVVPLVLVLGGVFIVKGLLAKEPTAAHRASWFLAAALLGVLLGVDAYAVGVAGLLSGPLALVVVIVVVQARTRLSDRGRRRAFALATVTALTAVLVGLTIFI